jgi:sulfate transport system permease protein
MTYLSVIVFLPMAAVSGHGIGLSIATHGSWLPWHWHWSLSLAAFWHAVTAPGAWRAIWLSVWLSLAVAIINAAMGVAIAWVLSRQRFRGAFIIEALIDIPFALPTIVAGVVFIYLYGPASPLHVSLFEVWTGLMVALLFVTLPF